MRAETRKRGETRKGGESGKVGGKKRKWPNLDREDWSLIKGAEVDGVGVGVGVGIGGDKKDKKRNRR